ncbi:MAG: ABC transporter permease [Eubacteriales bacterium]
MKQTSKVAFPYIIWMAVFIVIPLVLIGVFAFTTTVTADASGAVLDAETLTYIDSLNIDRETGAYTSGEPAEETAEEEQPDISSVIYPITEKTIFTLDNIFAVSDYLPVLFLSIWLALIATAVCLVIAYPLSYFISRLPYQRQHIMLMLVMLPMWMNFLLRTYAWMTLLERNGWINKLFSLVGMGPFEMINTQGAVVLGMVYNYLPFMILPLYSIMTKIDERSIEAAQDLGANSLRVFGKIVLPLSMPGIASGITMVFVPAVSTFIISRMLGGGTNMLIGDLIDLQFLGNAYNPNLGAAISLVLMIFVLLCMSITNQLDNEEMESVLL